MNPRKHTRGLYKPEQARESCGFGLFTTACSALTRMTHRGAVAVDGKTGDGCGVLMQFSGSFFRQVAGEENMRLGRVFGVGMLFLNKDPAIAKRSRQILEKHITNETLDIAGWRSVPVNPAVCGPTALDSMPCIEQVFVNAPSGWGPHDLELRLFVARRLAAFENMNLAQPDNHLVVTAVDGGRKAALGMVRYLDARGGKYFNESA